MQVDKYKHVDSLTNSHLLSKILLKSLPYNMTVFDLKWKTRMFMVMHYNGLCTHVENIVRTCIVTFQKASLGS